VRRYNVRFSRFILKLEIFAYLIFSGAILLHSSYAWWLPAIVIMLLSAFVFFSKYSIVTQFSPLTTLEFRSAPERLIWIDRNQQKHFPVEQMEVRMTRWFVLLKLGNKPDQMHRVMLKDSFDDTHQYASFRRQLLLNGQEKKVLY
jgi:hypothetical protein